MRTVVALLLVPLPLWAAPTADQIDAWVLDLDSPRYQAREAASKKLLDAGADAAPALGRVARRGDVEPSQRALKLLGDLADGPDAKAAVAARKQLRRLVEAETHLARDARTLLNRRQHSLVAALAGLGAECEEESGSVRHAHLGEVGEMDAAVALLAEFPDLRSLSASTKRFTDASLAHVARLSNLEEVNLFDSNITDDGLRHLAGLKKLRRLPMGHTRVTDAGLKTIAGMTQLEYLGVRGNRVTDAGLVHLKGLTNLEELYLGETRITDDGLKHLAPLTRLRSIYLQNTAVTDAGLEHLRAFRNLTIVYLGATKTTSDGRAALVRAVPGLHIDLDLKKK